MGFAFIIGLALGKAVVHWLSVNLHHVIQSAHAVATMHKSEMKLRN